MEIKISLHYYFKGAPSGLRQGLAIENLVQMMKNAFYFTLKALFALKMFKLCFLVLTF